MEKGEGLACKLSRGLGHLDCPISHISAVHHKRASHSGYGTQHTPCGCACLWCSTTSNQAPTVLEHAFVMQHDQCLLQLRSHRVAVARTLAMRHDQCPLHLRPLHVGAMASAASGRLGYSIGAPSSKVLSHLVGAPAGAASAAQASPDAHLPRGRAFGLRTAACLVACMPALEAQLCRIVGVRLLSGLIIAHHRRHKAW